MLSGVDENFRLYMIAPYCLLEHPPGFIKGIEGLMHGALLCNNTNGLGSLPYLSTERISHHTDINQLR
jgi:hypothetical protein